MNENKEIMNVLDMGELKASSSFELKKTSKGTNIRVKIYASDSVDAIDKAMQECTTRFKLLVDRYGEE